jgi:hypothetical protein
MQRDTPDSTPTRQVDAASVLDRVLRTQARPDVAAHEPADDRAHCIAAAAAIHSYLMTQRLLRTVA